jgi:4-hydroxy-tetrahydrodipicolinate synthase
MDVIHYAYPTVAKYYLQKRGINISGFTRTKTDTFTSDVKDKVDRLYDEYHLLVKELSIKLNHTKSLQ